MLTDQSDPRGKKRAGTLPGIPVSIKGANLTLHLISDLFFRRQRISLQGLSVSTTVSHGHSLPYFPGLLPPLSLLLTPSFLFSFLYRLVAVDSSSLYQQQILTPPFLPGSVSLLSKRSQWVLTSFFNGCYTCYGQPCHILSSLSPSISFSLLFSLRFLPYTG